jgi:endoglucanase
MSTPLLLGPLLAAVSAVTPVRVSQVGYPTHAPKLAIVVVDGAAEAPGFVVRRVPDGARVLEGRLGAAAADADSGDVVRMADFSALEAPGTYYLAVKGAGRSVDFPIGGDVFDRALYLSMRSFYGQRCGTAVDLGPEFPGYRHAACHRLGAYHASSGRTGEAPSVRGWHDAGDYGRYVVNSGITTGTLLWAYELFGERLRTLRLDIPESQDASPDLLDEVRWNLDWMLSMQDEDGGVWPKQTSEGFPGFVMPEDDHTSSEVMGTGAPAFKSSCATADLAAVAAIAGRVFRPFDASYAEANLAAARRGWAWLVGHPDVPFRNPPGVSTGEYGDRHCGDEVLWAAAELWRTTGEAAFDRYFREHQPSHRAALQGDEPPSWGNVAPLALWAYALAAPGDAALQASIRQDSSSAADTIVERSSRNGYRVSLTPANYVWGSNGVVANYGLQLLVANVLRPDPRYVEAARDDLYYLLGRNAFALSWVTGVGANPFRHPHHRPSGADSNEEPWPGLLSGGPNAHRQDAAVKALPELPPAKMYLDQQASYATNENAINWNAALVFLLAGVPD